MPVLQKLNLSLDPFQVYAAWCSKSPSVLLESARILPGMGRYSLVAQKPFMTLESRGRDIIKRTGSKTERLKADPLQALQDLLKKHAVASDPGGFPFTGGAVGFLGYEIKNVLESRFKEKSEGRIDIPDMYFLFVDEGVLFDHGSSSVYAFASSKAGVLRLQREVLSAVSQWKRSARLADVSALPRVESSVTRAQFVKMVLSAKRYIRKGDLYQANLSQRFSFPMRESASAIYAKLRAINPSAFFGILDAGSFQIVSGSPERLVKLRDGKLETRPIAGTRWRGRTLAEDQALSNELLLSEKERAEHVMLVDLERNDLGRVCRYGSVTVDELMAIEDYSHVKHIASNVQGILREGLGAVDVVRALFPGGTITGAPKIRCMEIIDELEPVPRGPYTGSMGYLSFSGNMDLNILIRSLVIRSGMAHLQVGAGIVADSDPEKEYDETLYKAEAVLNALFGKSGADRFLKARGTSRRVS